MRFSSVVLPAPFGPITPRNSPRSTPNDRSRTACRPPKLRVRDATLSIAGHLADEGFLHPARRQQGGGAVTLHDAPRADHVAPRSDAKRRAGILFHQKN